VKIITGLVCGPFKSEQEFKLAVLNAWRRRRENAAFTYFEIENEEKEPGMPDVIAVSPVLPACFTEFKYADKNGVIHFQKSQPLFYRCHRSLYIQVLAWDPRMDGRVVRLGPDEVVKLKSLWVALPDIPPNPEGDAA
jgi:hypothetical protein